MSGACGAHDHGLSPLANEPVRDRAYRRVLRLALAINLLMLGIEIAAGHQAGSLALFADALDFFADSATYAITLGVLTAALHTRARAALLKGASMALFGVALLGAAAWRAFEGGAPEAPVMGLVGALALAANVSVALLLLRHRGGDANRRSVWLCSRNDAIGNVAVVGAAVAVGLTGTRWPDLVVAAGMAALALSSAGSILRQALSELQQARPLHAPAE